MCSACVRRQIPGVQTQSTTVAQVLPTHTPVLFDAAVARAAEWLRAGELVALPTETVYGLAANALDARAVAKIFQTKGRPPTNPVIVHVGGINMARRCVAHWPPTADRLAQAFWPGPLTLVLPRSAEIPDIVTAGGPTVGVRWPRHTFIQAVIRACGFPLAAPSANVSNQVSPTNIGHVLKGLGHRIALIVDGGQSQVGIESTVLDLTARPPRVLRPGMIHGESLRALVGDLGSSDGGRPAGGPLPSPGLLPRHYAPGATLRLLGWRDDSDLHRQLADLNLSPTGTHVIAHTRIPSPDNLAQVRVLPHDAEAFARALYAELHRCDEEGAACIVVETPPEAPEWGAIHDRLRRAAA
jgi:L-threonylcarbamoyladenylate synthase